LCACRTQAVEWVRLDWTGVADEDKAAVRTLCVNNAAENPEHAELFEGLDAPEP